MFLSDGGELRVPGGVRWPGGVSLKPEDVLLEDAPRPLDVRHKFVADRSPSAGHDAASDAVVVGVVRGDRSGLLPG